MGAPPGRRSATSSRPGCCCSCSARCSARSAGGSAATASRSLFVLLRSCCSARRSTGTPTGSRWAWSARASSCRGEAPALHRRSSGSRCARRRRQAEALRDPGRLSRARCRRAAARSAARRSRSARACSGCASPAELEGDRRARDRAHPRPRRARPDDRGRARRRRSSRCRASAAGSQRALLFVLGAAGGVVRAPAALAEARVRGRPARGRSSAARRTGWPTRCSGSSRRCELVAFEASPATEPLYTMNPFAEEGLGDAVRHASAGRRARAPAARARPGLAREAPRGLERRRCRQPHWVPASRR